MKKGIIISVVLLVACIIFAAYAYTTWNKEQKVYTNIQKAVGYMDEGKYDKAIEMLKKAIELDPNNPTAYYDLALAYGNEEMFHRYYKLPGQTFSDAGYPEMQENYENAKKYLKILEERFPEYKPIAEMSLGDVEFLYYCGYTNREKFVLPHYLYALNHSKDVEKFLGKEGLSALYTNLARTYLAMAKVREAENYYKKAIEVYSDPGIDSAYEHLAWVELELGNVKEAYKVSKTFVKHAEKYGWDSDLGLAPAMISSYLLGKVDEAKSYAEKIIKEFPESAYLGEAYRILAMVEIKKGNKDKAIELLEEDIKSCSDSIANPEDATSIPTSMYERALSYYMLYKYTGIEDYLNKSISDFKWVVNNPKQTKREVAHRNYYILAHLSLASIYTQKGDYERAEYYVGKLKSELNSDADLMGWKGFIGDTIKELEKRIEGRQKVEMPKVVWILSH